MVALVFAAAITAVLSACGPHDDAYDPSHFHVHGAIAPRDVAVPATTIDGPAEFDGLYTEGSSTLSCCWVSPHASLLVRKRGAANTLVAGFRVPDVPRFAGGQTVSVRFGFPGAPPRVTKFLTIGDQYAMKIPVPPNLRAVKGLIPVEITCTIDYVPNRDAVARRTLFTVLRLRDTQPSGDVRHLGIVLLYLYFQ